MKRGFVWFMVLLLAFGILPMPVFADSEGTAMAGSGSAEDPFIITTLDQLDRVRNNLTAHYRLGANINASETADWDGGAGWEPIGESGGGDSSTPFTGVFDGAGHVIQNLTINRPSQDGVGLFGMIGSSGVVRNLGLEGGFIAGGNFTGALSGNNSGTVERSHASAAVKGGGVVGGLIGYDNGRISASFVTGDVAGTDNVGGLAGRSDGTVTESYATGSVDGRNIVGGLVGLKEGGDLNRTYFAGTVNGSGYDVGGLAGFLNGGDIRLSYNIGSVSGDHVVGGLVGITTDGHVGYSYSTGPVSAVAGDVGGALGANNGAMMAYNYWDAETSGQSSGCGYNNDDYGVFCVAANLTTAQALNQASYSGFDFTADWFMVDGATRPFLRTEWSRAIGNAHQLQLMAMDPSAEYTLADHIDFGTTFTDGSRADMWASSVGAGAGFAPVGDPTLGPFTGRIDGKGHTVRGLTINRPGTDQVGLIGNLGDGGLVRDIGVDGGSIRGGSSSGGLVGDNYGGTVELAFSTADVSGGNNVGGLVGNMFPGVVRQSYATGDVSGSYAVGGLVGRADLGSLVEDAYAIGSVAGNAEVGGLIGRHVGSVNRAYAAGRVSGSGSGIGGLVGRDFTPTSIVTSGYYDSSTSGRGAGNTTAAMKRKSTFAGWDFTGTWTIEEGVTYPALQGIAANLGMDAAPPAIVVMRVEQPNRILLTFDEAVNMRSALGFSVQADGVNVTVVGVVKTGAKTVEVTVSEQLRSGQDITLSYDSLAESIVDLANHPLLSVTDQPWPPEISISMTAADGNEYHDGTWTNQSVTVNASVYEVNGAVTEFVYSLDGGETWKAYTSSIELQEDGVHVLDFKAVDAMGMEAAERRTVKISRSGLALIPTMVKADGSAYAAGDWTNQGVTVSVYAEGGAGGVVSFTYTVDGGSSQAYANGTPIEFAEEGDHTIVFQAEDEAGHRLSDELKVKIDRSPPSVAFSPNGRESTAPSASSRTTAVDAGSGIDASTLQYAWSADRSAPTEGWTRFASGADLAKSGTAGDWYLHVRAADLAGNGMEAVSNRFRLGHWKISVSMTTADGNEYQDGTWTNQSVTVNASVYEVNGAITEFVYSLDGGETWKAYTSSIKLQEDGVHVLDFKAVDAMGMETAERRTVKISRSGLALIPTMVKADGSAYAAGDWTNQGVTVSVYAEGGAGGIVSFTYTVDGGPSQAYANGTPIEFVEEGDHTIVFQAEDEAGHRLSDELRVKIDRTPPSVTFSPNGRESTAPSALSRTTAVDAGSGIDASTLQYAWSADPSAPTEGWTPFASGADLAKSGTAGDWYLHVRAADLAGNGMEAVSNRFRLGQQNSSSDPLTDNADGGSVPLPNNSYLIGWNGGLVKFDGGEISFPAGAMDRPFQLTVDEIADPDALPLSDVESLSSRVFEFRKDLPGDFLINVTVKLRLNADAARRDGIQILLCWLNEETGHWVALGDPQIDFKNGTVSGTTNHFTKFAAIARTIGNTEPSAAFTDIRDHWAGETIQRLAGSGVVSGYPDGTFRPDRPITRAEFVSILTAALRWKPTADKTFADTENHWARVAVSTAYANGMIQGYDDNTFAPDQPITREEMAVMAANALHLENPQVVLPFADGDQISWWAKDAVEAAAERGILSGYPDGTVKPNAQATRAEAVMVIGRIIKMIEGK